LIVYDLLLEVFYYLYFILVLNCGLGLMQHFLRLVDSGNYLRRRLESIYSRLGVFQFKFNDLKV
jgi:hypothetical protein